MFQQALEIDLIWTIIFVVCRSAPPFPHELKRRSVFLNTILGKERSIVTPIAGTTRDAIDTVFKYHGEEIVDCLTTFVAR